MVHSRITAARTSNSILWPPGFAFLNGISSQLWCYAIFLLIFCPYQSDEAIIPLTELQSSSENANEQERTLQRSPTSNTFLSAGPDLHLVGRLFLGPINRRIFDGAILLHLYGFFAIDSLGSLQLTTSAAYQFSSHMPLLAARHMANSLASPILG